MPTYDPLRDSTDTLMAAALATLTAAGYSWNRYTTPFSQYLATALTGISGSPASNLTMGMGELLASLVNELGAGPVSHLTSSHGQLLALLGGAGTTPTAPVLAMDPAWTTADATPDFIADFDDTVAAGDSFRLQIQAAGGDWSSPVSDTNHTITAPEDATNQVSLSNGSLSNGNFEARANVTHTTTSNWSNTVSFTIAAATANNRIASAGNKRIASASNYRIKAT